MGLESLTIEQLKDFVESREWAVLCDEMNELILAARAEYDDADTMEKVSHIQGRIFALRRLQGHPEVVIEIMENSRDNPEKEDENHGDQ